MSRVTTCHGELNAAPSHSCKAGMPLSSYTPLDARSLIDTRPITISSGCRRMALLVALVIVVFRGFVVGIAVRGRAVRVLDPLEQFAEIARRLALLRFLAGVADQRAALLRVGIRVLADELGQRRVVGEELLAGALDPVESGRFRLVDAVVCVE